MLRVVAVAGSGTLLAAAACTMSSSSGSVAGSLAYPDSGYEDTSVDQAADGTGPSPEAGDALLGVVAADSGEDSPSASDGAVDGASDGGSDSAFDGPLGVVPTPDSGQD